MVSIRVALLLLHLLTTFSIIFAFPKQRLVCVKKFAEVQQPFLLKLQPRRQNGPMRFFMAVSDPNESGKISFTNQVLFAIGGTTSMVVAGTFFAILAYQRDALMVSFFIGSILNGILSKVLKKVLNQDRPIPAFDNIEQPSDKGMPSSHAMSLGFIGTFTALTLHWTVAPIALYGATSLYYRVQTKLHTKEQVTVGLLVGTLNGFIWRTLVDGSNPAVPQINVMDFVSKHFLDANGILPIPFLVVPAIAGVVVVGSFERKASKWIKKLKSKKE